MTLKLNADKREITGRKVKSLRKAGILPANIYGKDVKSVSIKLPLKDFNTIYEKAGETSLIEISLGNSKKSVLISDVQIDPISAYPIHVDFKEVNLKEKVNATVPVELQGTAPAETQGLGTLVQQVSELEVEALPLDLPENLVGDVSGLDTLESRLLVKDLKYDKTKVKVDAEPDLVVALIQEAVEEVEPVAVPAEGTEEQASEEQPSPVPEEKVESEPKA